MRGIFGVLVGIVLFAIGLAGLGFALHQMMTQADPHAALKAAAGLGTFVVVCLASVVAISY
jgi:formate-dependent nitrite reductase membrane component NrfD